MQAQLASRRAESDSALLRRQLLELELCRGQLADAQAAHDASSTEARAARAQVVAALALVRVRVRARRARAGRGGFGLG